MKTISLLAILLAVGLVGCSSPSSDLSKDADKQLRDNLSRPLNEEEIKMMGGGGGDQGGKAAAPPSDKPRGGG